MAILNKVKNFMESRIIFTGAELDVFTLIDRKINDPKNIAEKINADLRGLVRLLDALVSIGILKKEKSLYFLLEESKVLSSDHGQTVLPMVLHMNDMWDNWTYLTEAVIQGKNPGKVAWSDDLDKNTKSFIGAMHVAGRKLAAEIASELDLSQFKKLLDIGGASGTYTIAFLEKNPEMKALIFDLPEVIPMSQTGINKAGLAKRVEFQKGNFYEDELPKGCDLALLSAIIHQNSPVENFELYSKIFNSIEPGGMLVIRDHIMDNSRTNPPSGAVFAINMLVATKGGDTYTFDEVKNSLEKAGFENVCFARKGSDMDCIITCKKSR
jgi:precorrin-6B methylase 2